MAAVARLQAFSTGGSVGSQVAARGRRTRLRGRRPDVRLGVRKEGRRSKPGRAAGSDPAACASEASDDHVLLAVRPRWQTKRTRGAPK